VTWKVLETRETTVGEIPVVEKQLEGVVDNSSCPSIEVKISMTLGTPKNAEKPVPVLMMYGFSFGPRPGAARPGQPPAGGGNAQNAAPPPGPRQDDALDLPVPTETKSSSRQAGATPRSFRPAFNPITAPV
jgi:hypothetical protein